MLLHLLALMLLLSVLHTPLRLQLIECCPLLLVLILAQLISKADPRAMLLDVLRLVDLSEGRIELCVWVWVRLVIEPMRQLGLNGYNWEHLPPLLRNLIHLLDRLLGAYELVRDRL